MFDCELYREYWNNRLKDYRKYEDKRRVVKKEFKMNDKKKISDLEEEIRILKDHIHMQEEIISKQELVIAEFHNRELARSKWGDKAPVFDIDRYYESLSGGYDD